MFNIAERQYMICKRQTLVEQCSIGEQMYE